MTRLLMMLMMTLSLAAMAGGPDTVIDRVEFENSDILAVINVVKHQAETQVWCQVGRKDIEAAPKVDFSFRRMPAREILRYACIQSGLHFDITDQGYMSITKNPVFHSGFWTVDIISRDPTPERLVEYFKNGGVEFPPGSKIYYNRAKSMLTAVNTVENLRRIGLISGASYHLLPTPKLSLERAPYDIVNPLVEEKLTTVEVGPFDIEDVSIAAMLNKMHQDSIKNDPAGIGVNFFLMPFPEGVDPVINVNLGRMSLKYMLDSICRASGLVYRFDDYAVIVSVPETKIEVKKDDKQPASATSPGPLSADRDVFAKPRGGR